MVPAIKLAEKKPITRLNPIFQWEQQQYLLVLQEMAVIPVNNLGVKVAELERLRGEF